MNDEEYMNIALKEAEKALDFEEVPVGAVVVLDNEIIGIGHNTRQKTHDITNHAELIAIRNASKKICDWRLDKATLYITLSPCIMCASAIKESRIKRIVIGLNNQDLKTKEITDLILKDREIKTGIKEQESLLLLQKFFKKQREKNK